jgi:putative inorganic carbon (hco3(-)) transporter
VIFLLGLVQIPLWAKQGWYFVAGVMLTILLGYVTALLSIPVLIILGVLGALVGLSYISPFAALSAMLILAPLRTLIATESPLIFPIDIGQLAFLGLMICWFIWNVVRDKVVIKGFWTPLTTPLVIFLLVTGLSAFHALSLLAWLTEWVKWVQVLLILTLVVNLAAEERKWEWIIFVLVTSAVANALVGAYEFLGGSGALHLLINDRFFRAFGTFGQPNPFGGFMGMVIPLSLAAFVGYMLRLKGSIGTNRGLYIGLMVYYLLSSLILVAGILMSWSRGAWLGLAGALFAAVFMLPRRWWYGMILFIVIVAAFVVVWGAGLIPDSVVERLGTSGQELLAFEDARGVDITPVNYAVVERLAHWQAAINMAVAHPFGGVGFGNYEVAYAQNRLLNWSESLGHAHNYYLNVLAEIGVGGLLAYGSVLIYIILLCWRACRHPDNLARLVVIGILSSWVYICIHSIFDNLFVNNLFLHIGVGLGLLVVLHGQLRAGVRMGA